MSWLDGVTEVREKLWGAVIEVGLPACSDMKIKGKKNTHKKKQVRSWKSSVGTAVTFRVEPSIWSQISLYIRYSRAGCKKVRCHCHALRRKVVTVSSLEKQRSEQKHFSPRSDAAISGAEPASCQTLHRTIAQEMSNATVISIIRWRCVCKLVVI